MINILKYHQESKHSRQGMARSPGFLDWQNQPNPFRYYNGTEHVHLPFLKEDPELAYSELFTPPSGNGRPLDLESIGAFLELSVAISAWKATNVTRWSLRINPSSGNLHPTETHLLLPPGITKSGGIFHYVPLWHALELRSVIPDILWEKLISHFQANGFLLALSSIFWRESWKYGERAFRYCHHDVGHALACLSFSARINGWSLTVLSDLSDRQVERIIGFDRITWSSSDREHADVLCWIAADGSNPQPLNLSLPGAILQDFRKIPISGQPNSLSRESVAWDLIYDAASASEKPVTQTKADLLSSPLPEDMEVVSSTATEVIRKRRSAVSYDNNRAISDRTFFSILARTLPQPKPPFNLMTGLNHIDLFLFVHQVSDLQRGLYFFSRNPFNFDAFRKAANPDFDWRQIRMDMPLYQLKEGDYRIKTIEISCYQEIAGFSAFSLAMIAPLPQIVHQAAYRYRFLFWEAGIIGQILYLSAEAHGVRGTGIGCYFDDEVHDLMGLKQNDFQSLYHFTIGHPFEDERLTTLPPYHHLQRNPASRTSYE